MKPIIKVYELLARTIRTVYLATLIVQNATIVNVLVKSRALLALSMRM